MVDPSDDAPAGEGGMTTEKQCMGARVLARPCLPSSSSKNPKIHILHPPTHAHHAATGFWDAQTVIQGLGEGSASSSSHTEHGDSDLPRLIGSGGGERSEGAIGGGDKMSILAIGEVARLESIVGGG
eukprot:5933660-Prymnesium_polylepis.1